MKLYNCLIRCVRPDDLAAPLVDLAVPKNSLWVWDLPCLPEWEAALMELERVIRRHKSVLARLRGSEDYTLYLRYIADHEPTLPTALVEMLRQLGIAIELEPNVELLSAAD